MKADSRRKLKLASTPFAAGLTAILLTAPLLSGCKPKAGGDAKAGGAPGAATTAENQPTPVNVAPASEQAVSKLVPVTGSIAALQSISIMPKVTANVLSVAGREGDAVHAGEVVVRLDPSEFEAQQRQAEAALGQARANLQDAKAKLQQAQTNYKLQLTQSDTAVQNAQAALAAAEANLAVARQPQRNEVVKQSQISVEQAQANYDKAVSDRTRYEALYKEGATSATTLESYQTAEKVQLANLENAKQSLLISNTGGRQEDIRASQEQVRQAKIALQLAKSNVQQNAVRQSDIRSAQAAVAQSEAAVAQNQATVAYQKQQVSYCTITSPINGIIASRSGEPGTLAGPGAQTFSQSTSGGGGAVLTVVALDTVYYQAQVPETDIGSVQPGRTVQVAVDAFPNRKFNGTVSTLFPSGSTASRNFTVAIKIPNADRALRPGMYARGNVVAMSRQGVVIPKDAIVSNGDGSQQAVFVAVNGKVAARHAVKVGIQTSTTSEILSGVNAGDQVIVAGQDGLHDGSSILIEKPTGETKEASAGSAASGSGSAQ